MICNTWDIAVAPFPFVDAPHVKPRPVLVLSSAAFQKKNGHTLLAMITTGGGTQWPSDVAIEHLLGTGLSVTSVIRPKFFTLDNRIVQRKIGVLNVRDQGVVRKQFLEHLL